MGGKTAGWDFCNHLRSCMRHLGFESCLANPDVWMRPALMDDGHEVWEYCLLYTNDVLCIGPNPKQTLTTEIGKYFELKKESVGPPMIYLGGKCSQVILENSVKCWAYSPTQYVKAAITNMESYLCKHGMKLHRHANTPIQTLYRPELDISEQLGSEDAAYYQSLIRILCWMVELG